MDNLPEITDLLTKLALYVQSTTHASPINDPLEEDDSQSIDLAISKLNQSLNLTEDTTGVRVLDSALSIMCFKAPQVFYSTIECMMKTIVSVLNSSVKCQGLRLGKEEFLLVGSSMSKRNFLEFVEVANDIISKLDERGMPSHSLSCAVARVAVSTSSFSLLVPPMYLLDVKSIDTRSTSIQKLLSYLPREFSFDNNDIPPRLQSWYLDPLTLKNDIMVIFEGTMQRPFLSLSKEFCERMEWHNILLCLVISPIMFIHTRALLHNWFLLTGLGSVLEFLSELVAVILDVNSRPTFWGIPIELGSKLPLYSAYFPYQSTVLRILAGSLSSSSFLRLSQKICESVIVREQFGQISKPSAVKISSIDSKSLWALAICFPDWFYFASVLLFCNSSFQKCFQLKCMSGVYICGQTSSMEQPSAAPAAKYIAWLLSPHSKSHQDMLFDCLSKISECWDLKPIGSGSSGRGPPGNKKKLKKLKLQESEDDFCLTNEYQCQVLGLWLREFQAIMMSGVELVNNSSSSLQNSMLFRRIPLGILIGFPNYVKEDGFELLLHYAAAGKMLHFTNKSNRMGCSKQNFGERENFATNIECTKEEAVAGVCLVFSLTDIVERMSTSLFKNDKSEMDIVCTVKLRVSRYLIKCIKRLIQSIIDEDGDVMPTDLHDKLEHWRHQGQEMLKVDKDLDDVIKGLSHTLVAL